MALSSVLTPFSLGTVVGSIATGRVPVGNAAGSVITSWLNVPSVLIGVVAVAFSGYLAAVYLAADSVRGTDPGLTRAFRARALVAGVVSGAVALAGLLVMRHSGLNLTSGLALVMVAVSAVAGLATVALCWRSRFQLARLSAALAVAAVVAGWAAAQAPRMLPGLTVTQAAAGRSTLIALVIAVACGGVVLIPSLALLYTLFLRGRLDAPESAPATGAERVAAGGPDPHAPDTAPGPRTGGTARTTSTGGTVRTTSTAGRASRAWATVAVVGLLAGAGLLVFTDPVWLHGLGVAFFLACAVSTFRLAHDRDGR